MVEANEATLVTLLAGLVILAAYIASFILWGQSLLKYGRRVLSNLVPLRARERPFWSPVHFLLTFGLFVFTVSLLAGFTIGNPELQTIVVQLTLNTLGGIVAVVGALLMMSMHFPRAIARLGLVPTVPDIRLGLFAAVMILPPVMIISGIVSNLVEYHHPVLDSLAAEPGLRLFIVMVIGTAVVTPFIEEFLFRVLLQGGMQGLADRFSRVDVEPEGAIATPDVVATVGESTGSELSDSQVMNPYAFGTRVVSDDESIPSSEASSASVDQRFRPKAWWPIVAASILFACMHLGQGAAPIPLFFLSLGLGFLYRQTGNITAPLVVHAVLNFITLAVNFAEISGKP